MECLTCIAGVPYPGWGAGGCTVRSPNVPVASADADMPDFMQNIESIEFDDCKLRVGDISWPKLSIRGMSRAPFVSNSDLSTNRKLAGLLVAKYKSADYRGMSLERCIAQDAVRRSMQDALYNLGIPYGWRTPAGIADYWLGSVALRALPIPAPLTARELEMSR